MKVFPAISLTITLATLLVLVTITFVDSNDGVMLIPSSSLLVTKGLVLLSSPICSSSINGSQHIFHSILPVTLLSSGLPVQSPGSPIIGAKNSSHSDPFSPSAQYSSAVNVSLSSSKQNYSNSYVIIFIGTPAYSIEGTFARSAQLTGGADITFA